MHMDSDLFRNLQEQLVDVFIDESGYKISIFFWGEKASEQINLLERGSTNLLIENIYISTEASIWFEIWRVMDPSLKTGGRGS